VIDVQEDTTGITAPPLSPYKGNAEYITRLNKVIEYMNSKNILIVYVKQEFDGLWGKTLSWTVLVDRILKGTPVLKSIKE